jgi:hypothetical protein
MLDIKEKIDVMKISAASLIPNFPLEKHEKDGFYFDYIEPTIFDVLGGSSQSRGVKFYSQQSKCSPNTNRVPARQNN